MSDRQRELEQLAQALESNPDYVSGRRAFPRTVTPDDGADLALLLQRQVDRGTAARAEAASQGGLHLACTRGCNTCCEELIMVHAPEAQVVARWLLQPENRQILADFRTRYPAWRARVGDLPARVEAAAALGDQAALERIFSYQPEARNLCALNAGGDCTVYPVRPLVCRNGHALDDPSKCGLYDPVGQGRREALAFVPLDQFMARSGLLLRAAHQAIVGQRAPRRPLCELVWEMTAPG
ncbi:MAG: hypothetical protein IT370_00260 [Deltaproteobacteria bacterium]|nr:hypothetical protein [Deltaproteobacteria bacterium]